MAPVLVGRAYLLTWAVDSDNIMHHHHQMKQHILVCGIMVITLCWSGCWGLQHGITCIVLVVLGCAGVVMGGQQGLWAVVAIGDVGGVVWD